MGTATYTQAHRPMAVTTPLGADVLLLPGFAGREAISQPFTFQLEMLAENDQEVAFDRLLGQPVTVRLRLPGDAQRYFHGICSRVSERGRDATFTSYHLEMVPEFWLLSRSAQSRIFQNKSVPDILREVLEGLDHVPRCSSEQRRAVPQCAKWKGDSHDRIGTRLAHTVSHVAQSFSSDRDGRPGRY
jgi:uncharacterized protein involved in type VI secretion and phage assembly